MSTSYLDNKKSVINRCTEITNDSNHTLKYRMKKRSRCKSTKPKERSSKQSNLDNQKYRSRSDGNILAPKSSNNPNAKKCVKTYSDSIPKYSSKKKTYANSISKRCVKRVSTSISKTGSKTKARRNSISIRYEEQVSPPNSKSSCNSKKKSGPKRKRRRRPKSTKPSYVIKMVGNIIYRRLQRVSIVQSGINLVRRMSSCSLIEKLLGPQYSQMADNDLKPCDIENGTCAENGESIMECKLNRNANARPTKSATRAHVDISTPSGGFGCSDHMPLATTRKAKKLRHRKARKVYRGLVARSIGIPANRGICKEDRKALNKAIGRPSKRSRHCLRAMREGVAIKLSTTTKSRKIRLVTSAKRESEEEQFPTVSANPIMKRRSLKDKELGSSEETKSSSEKREMNGSLIMSRNDSVGDSLSLQDKRKSSSASGSRKRERKVKARKWNALLKLGTSGPTSSVAAALAIASSVSQKSKRNQRETEKRAKEELRHKQQNEKAKTPVMTASRRSSTTQAKISSPEIPEWPSLSNSRRTKGFVKEKAEEIVRTKCGAPAGTRMTRKCWADIVSKSVKESLQKRSEADDKGIEDKTDGSSQTSKKTWAAIAAASACHFPWRKGENQQNEPQAPLETSECSRRKKKQKKKKKKKASQALCYDRIWLTCQSAKGTAHFQNSYKVQGGDNKDTKISQRHLPRLRSAPGSPHKRLCDKRRDVQQPFQAEKTWSRSCSTRSRPNETLQTPLVPSNSAGTSLAKEQQVVATVSDRDSCGENVCLVDNMKVVCAKQTGHVISLKEYTHDSQDLDTTTHENVNKCNNRTQNVLKNISKLAGPSKPRKIPTRACTVSASSINSDVSASGVTMANSKEDLCSQMSSMTFDTTEPSTSSTHHASGKQKIMGVQSPPVCLPQEKKVSVKYRALLRDRGCACPDARAVSEMNTRNRRAGALQSDKQIARAMRRRIRNEQQNIAHNQHRSACGRVANLSGEGGTACEQSISHDHNPEPPGTSTEANHTPNLRRTRARSKQNNDRNSHDEQTFIERTPSSSSTDDVIFWRPTDKSGSNNSRSQPPKKVWQITKTGLETSKAYSCLSILRPEGASSAPQLNEGSNKIQVELNPGLQVLDMTWWDAYLRQKTPTVDHT